MTNKQRHQRQKHHKFSKKYIIIDLSALSIHNSLPVHNQSDLSNVPLLYEFHEKYKSLTKNEFWHGRQEWQIVCKVGFLNVQWSSSLDSSPLLFMNQMSCSCSMYSCKEFHSKYRFKPFCVLTGLYELNLSTVNLNICNSHI
jgi:hypothetical protein